MTINKPRSFWKMVNSSTNRAGVFDNYIRFGERSMERFQSYQHPNVLFCNFKNVGEFGFYRTNIVTMH